MKSYQQSIIIKSLKCTSSSGGQHTRLTQPSASLSALKQTQQWAVCTWPCVSCFQIYSTVAHSAAKCDTTGGTTFILTDVSQVKPVTVVMRATDTMFPRFHLKSIIIFFRSLCLIIGQTRWPNLTLWPKNWNISSFFLNVKKKNGIDCNVPWQHCVSRPH